MLLLLPVLTGLLLMASFPRIDHGYLAWVALTPLIVFVSLTKTRMRAFGGGFVAAAIAFSALLTWVPKVLSHYGGMPVVLSWLAYALMAIVLACYPAIVCLLVKHWIMRGGKAFLLFFPVTWIMFEYVLSIFPFGGFPWFLLGYTQSRYLNIIQIADITGIYGLSFLILSANTAIAWLILQRNSRFSSYGPLVAAVLLITASFFYGRMALKNWENTNPQFKTAMLQGNLSFDDSPKELLEKTQEGYIQMADSIKSTNVDLLILPEAPSPVFFQFDSVFRRSLEKLATRYPLGLVLNNINYTEIGSEERYSNSAFILDNKGRLTGIYDKMHLVPFGEYIPLKKIFFFSESITKDVGEFTPGREFKIVKIGKHPSNVIICFEAVFPSLVRRFVEGGSQLIINLTNDGWYGVSAAPYQHLAITRLRAVENRRYLLRATNSGFSAIIEPTGRIQASTGLMTEAICEGRFGFLKEKTLYTQYGDVFVFLCAIISFGAWIFIEVHI